MIIRPDKEVITLVLATVIDLLSVSFYVRGPTGQDGEWVAIFSPGVRL